MSCSMPASLPADRTQTRVGRSRGGCARCYESAHRALVATVRCAVSLRVRLLNGLMAPSSADVATSDSALFSCVRGGRTRRPCETLDYSSDDQDFLAPRIAQSMGLGQMLVAVPEH